MLPIALLQCLGKALVRSAGNVLGGGILGNILVDAGEDAWKEWNREKEEAARCDELRAIVQMAKVEFRQQVEEVVRQVAGDQPKEVQQRVLEGLQEVPELARKSLRRTVDQNGNLKTSGIVLPQPEDFVAVLSSVRSSLVPKQEAEAPLARVTLTLMNGPNQGQQFTFTERATCVMGREKDCHPQFPKDKQHQAISRHHALLDINPPDVFIRDLGSKFGTYLDGELIGKRPSEMSAEEGKSLLFKDHKLADGQEIKLSEKGAAVFRVEIILPAQCIECGVYIAEDEKVQHEQKPSVYHCRQCLTKAAVDQATLIRRCVQCNRDVTGESGSNRPGEFICNRCRQDPEQLLHNYQSQPLAQRNSIPVIDGYTIRKRLGRGGMGEVWLAQHKKSGEMVAIKLMLPEVAADQRAVSRALRELANSRLLRHRNVVRLLNVEYVSGMFVMVLEYCDGGSVAQLMKLRGGKLPVDEGINITLQALEGLQYAHNIFEKDKGIVHRDISPDNLFLSCQGSARLTKVGDYGLAKALDDAGLSGSTRTGEVAGKPYFMPRIQVVDFKNVGSEVDVWATAASLYFMLTGEVPRDFSKGGDPWLTVLEEDPIPIRQHQPSLPAPLADIIDSALREEPSITFQTAEDFKEALANLPWR